MHRAMMAVASVLVGAAAQTCQSGSLMQLRAAMETNHIHPPINPSIHPPIQVVLMVMTAPLSQKRRDLHRWSLSELTHDVTVSDVPVQFVVKYAVGDTYPCYNETDQIQAKNLLNAEAQKYGDIAFLNISDGCKPGKIEQSPLPPGWWKLSYCDTGKSWQLFQWAHRHYPRAGLIFRQDDDALVDWRVFLPRMLARAHASVNQLSFHRLFFGIQHRTIAAVQNKTCVEGQV